MSVLLRRVGPEIILSLILPTIGIGQTTTLQKCLAIASQNNLSVKEAKATLVSSLYNFQAEKKSYLPKADLLSSYTYLSSPITVNLQTVKDGIVEGTSRQSVNAVKEAYKQLTGNNLTQTEQDRIYNVSRNIIENIYPDYNPGLSKQSYFVAGVGVRQPIYLGRKLDAAGNLAQSLTVSAGINVDLVNKEVDFLIVVQYLRILYLNTLFDKQQAIVNALAKNSRYAQELVNNQILAPYQKNWAHVLLTQAQSHLSNITMEQQNAYTELNKLLGIPLDSALLITDTLKYAVIGLQDPENGYWTDNPIYRIADNKVSYAKTAEKISKSFSLPNIFAIGNYNLYQRDLPLLIPDWFVGIELQWNIYNGQTRKRTLAVRKLIEEARLAEESTKLSIQVLTTVATNKMRSFQNEVASLDHARAEACTTTRLITERMNNQLSSPKDVNDALLIEAEIEKAYHTAVLGYLIAAAEYFNSLGKPQQMTQYIK